jgi:hypothetical protein
MSAYNAYDKGYLPTSGGLDQQPALFHPIMSVIQSSISDETGYKKATGKGRDKAVQQSIASKPGKKPGSVSLLNGPKNEDTPGFRRL